MKQYLNKTFQVHPSVKVDGPQLNSYHLILFDGLFLEIQFYRKDYEHPELEGQNKNQQLRGPRYVPIDITRIYLCQGGTSKIDISELHVSEYFDIDFIQLKNDLEYRLLP
jgi:hypothetical protein